VTGAERFDSDAKDEDITGAMLVATMDAVNFYAVISRDLFRLLTGAG
jgi:hypothetical protein